MSMFRNRITKIVIVLIVCLLPILTESTKKSSRTLKSSNSSIDGYSTNFGNNTNYIPTETDIEKDLSQKWKTMESFLRKFLTPLCDKNLPFLSHVTDTVDLSHNCKRDLMKMLTGIKQLKYWAIKMLDSSDILPTGIEFGTLNALGDYDQCLDVDVPGNFKGQYCNIEIMMPLPKRKRMVRMDIEMAELKQLFQPDEFFKFFTKYWQFFFHVKPRLSICVPSTCSKEELQNISNKAVGTLGLPFGLHVPNCDVLDEEIKFDRTEIVAMFILGILLFLVIASTVVDIYLKIICNKDENSNTNISLETKYLLCFSLYTNTKKLLKTDSEKNSIQIFHGIRFLTTFWVILLHTCLYHNLQATGSTLNLYASVGSLPFQFVINGFLNVQIFFFMSSTIHSYRAMLKKEKINITKHIFRRIWRILPAFMLVIVCVILVPYLGSGPVWKETIRNRLTENCRSRWWTNFLFINNFIKNETMCLQWLWYIPVDFHLYILSLLVIIPMKSNPRLALIINALLMIGLMVISGAFHVYYKLTPMIVGAYSNPEDISYFLERGYFRTYLHGSSVCIGLAVGYFLANKPSKLHIPLKISIPLWCLSCVFFLGAIFGVSSWSEGNIPSMGVSVLYAGTSKIMIAAAMTWVTIACTTGNGGFVTKFLSQPIFVPLGRLCYMTYLIHSIIHWMYVGSTRTLIRLELRTTVYLYCANVLVSFICASILTLIFESPFLALDKLMFSEKASNRTIRQVELVNGKQHVSTRNENNAEDTNSQKKVD